MKNVNIKIEKKSRTLSFIDIYVNYLLGLLVIGLLGIDADSLLILLSAAITHIAAAPALASVILDYRANAYITKNKKIIINQESGKEEFVLYNQIVKVSWLNH